MADGALRHAEIERFFGDGYHRFRLAMGQLRELEDKHKAGAPAIWRRLIAIDWFTDDVREVLRLGLIGGGMDAFEAFKLIDRYYDNDYKLPAASLAIEILDAALTPPEGQTSAVDPPDDDQKKNTTASE